MDLVNSRINSVTSIITGNQREFENIIIILLFYKIFSSLERIGIENQQWEHAISAFIDRSKLEKAEKPGNSKASTEGGVPVGLRGVPDFTYFFRLS